MEFNIIYPAGIRCTGDEILKILNLKRMSSVFGSLNMKKFNNIIKCIESDFDILINKNNIVSTKFIRSMRKKPYVRTMNKLFDDMDDWDSSTIPHYDLSTEKDMGHILRCIERFNKIRDNNIFTLFLNISVASEYNNTINTEKLVEVLNNTKWSNFHIIFIYFSEKKEEKKINKIFSDKFKSGYIINDTCYTNSKEYKKASIYLKEILKEYNINNLFSINHINNL